MADTTPYFTDVLRQLGAGQPLSRSVAFLNQWGQREGVPQNIDPYNLLGTTLPMNGSHGTNGPGVQAYPSYDTGVRATASMLNQSNFSALKQALLSGNPDSFRNDPAVQREFSLWSGGGYNWPTSTGGGGTTAPAAPPQQQGVGPQSKAASATSVNSFGGVVQALLGDASSKGFVDPGLNLANAPGALQGPGKGTGSTTADTKLLNALLAPSAGQGVTPKQVFSQRPEPAVGSTPSQPGPSRLVSLPPAISTHPVQVNAAVLPAVEQIASMFGVKANSGFRSAQHNAEVGGAAHSDHLSGNAVDFVGSTEAMRRLYSWAQGKFPYVEPWGQAGGNHVHVSFIR